MAKKDASAGAPAEKGSPEDRQIQERLTRLRDEYTKLHTKKIATEQDRKNLEQRLGELREQAEREYGTSDIEQLRLLLDERRKENERMVAEYQRHIEEIRERLAEIEKSAGEERS